MIKAFNKIIQEVYEDKDYIYKWNYYSDSNQIFQDPFKSIAPLFPNAN